MRDDEVEMTLERAEAGVRAARGYWRDPRHHKSIVLFELRVAIKRLVTVWWHVFRRRV